uniref:Secreted protein n=1 Tax=Nyssomyia neivai TaxID=330878 RepID=A0A1L8D803_9DIPT
MSRIPLLWLQLFSNVPQRCSSASSMTSQCLRIQRNSSRRKPRGWERLRKVVVWISSQLHGVSLMTGIRVKFATVPIHRKAWKQIVMLVRKL